MAGLHSRSPKRRGSLGETTDRSDSSTTDEAPALLRANRFADIRFRMKSAKALTPRGSGSFQPRTARVRMGSMSARGHFDEIDEVVQAHLRAVDQTGRLTRLSYGVYSVGGGTKRVSISVKNGKPLVRIGGGASIHLDTYLVNH